jgi:hypothetical protein
MTFRFREETGRKGGGKERDEQPDHA